MLRSLLSPGPLLVLLVVVGSIPVECAPRVPFGSSGLTAPIAEFVNVTYEFEGSPWGSAAEAMAAGVFIPDNNIITGVNYFYNASTDSELLFVCVPRWRRGVPSTLNIVVRNAVEGGGPPFVLRPWPSWNFNLQVVRYVQSVWVDHATARIFVIDAGRENFFSADPDAVINGPAALLILDIASGAVLFRHEFTDEILPFNSSFLNDLVYDSTRELVYFTDTNIAGRGGLVVLDLRTRFARRHEGPSTRAEPWYVVRILNVTYPMTSPVDGITLSTDGRRLFYSLIQGAPLFALDARVFADPNATSGMIAATVQNLTVKVSFSDGLRTLPTANRPGLPEDLILYGAIGDCALWAVALPPWAGNGTNPRAVHIPLAQDNDTLQWIDTFAYIDAPYTRTGRAPLVLLTSNRLQRYFARTLSYDGSEGANFRVFAVEYAG